MLRIDKFQNGRWRSIDLHDLILPSGAWCHKLTQADLYKELKTLKVPGIAPTQGWQELALAWGNVLADRKDATR